MARFVRARRGAIIKANRFGGGLLWSGLVRRGLAGHGRVGQG